MKKQQIATKVTQATMRRAEKKAIKAGFVFENGRANISAWSSWIIERASK